MSLKLSLDRAVIGILLLMFLLTGMCTPNVVAQQKEPSPIEVELVVPQQAGPGSVVDILIKYDVVDPRAGADLNYNVFGPCHILTRDPEPPNPLVNTWVPGRDGTQGTIKIRIQIDQGTDGQTIHHQVEVRWGIKAQKFEAKMGVKYVPPAPTPTPSPRPRPQPTATPTMPPPPAIPSLELLKVTFLSPEPDGQPISVVEANQEIALQVHYTSSGDLENVVAVLRFEPDVVNLNDLERTDEGYVLALPALPAAPGGDTLFGVPVRGRIRPYVDGGERYEIEAFALLEVTEGTIENVPQEIISEPLQVSQSLLVVVSANVEAALVRAGGNIIVHALCENLGQIPSSSLSLRIAGLPEGFIVNPDEQTIARIDGDGGSEERLFTIHTPEDVEQVVTFRVAVMLGETVIESGSMTVRVASPVPLRLDASVNRSTVRAGEAIYVNLLCTNGGHLAAKNVTAKLIDTTDNLGVLLQDLGDIGPGESRESLFVAQVPPDFPADVVVSLVVQVISEDGEVTESAPPIPVEIACVPALSMSVQPPTGRLVGEQSVEAVVVLRNVSQCGARDVSLSMEGLPDGFIVPPEQKIAELPPGGTRHLTFNFLIPEGYQGTASFVLRVSDSLGLEILSPPSSFSVGGVSVVFTIVFGSLAILAVAAMVVGVVFYFRCR